MIQKTASTSVIALQLNLLRCAEYRLGPFCSHTALRAVRKIQDGGIRELAYGHSALLPYLGNILSLIACCVASLTQHVTLFPVVTATCDAISGSDESGLPLVGKTGCKPDVSSFSFFPKSSRGNK